MLDQSFSVKSLLRVTGKNEIIKYQLGREKKDYELNLKPISDIMLDESYMICGANRSKINGKDIFCTVSPQDHYALKKIAKDLKRLYKISMLNRDDISEQVLRILESSVGFSIVRLDVKNFYESISYDSLYGKLFKDKLLTSKSLSILNSLRLYIDKCLPRGLSISPVLSEIFMREVDDKIQRIESVYYYARYVDDIIIISSSASNFIYENVSEILRGHNLDINNKTYKADVSISQESNFLAVNKFDFLGYKYTVRNREFNGKRIVDVTLSDDKVRKIKSRIIHCIISRAYDAGANAEKAELFVKRIKVLAGNYPITSKKEDFGILKGGLFYSNRLVNKPCIFFDFNRFLKSAINSRRNNFFGRAVSKISTIEKQELNNICFSTGFKDRTYYLFSLEEMNEVKQCWKNKNHKRKKRI